MTAMAKFVASFPPNHTDGKGEPDPHADYRVNPYSYLAIDGVITGEYKYIISMKPKEIPKGFHITQHQKLPGLRKFKVVKDGADTYDIVYVGTMMVQNGFAYIAGQMLFLEGPYDYLTQVWFPPFAVSYPLEHPSGMTNRDVVAQVMEDHRPKLIESIKANGNDTTKDGILDFDLTKGHVLYPPHPTCTICQAKLLVYENSRCPVCDDPGHNSKEDYEQMKSGYEDEIAELRSKLILKGARMAEQQEAVQEMKAEIKKMETRLNEKETELVCARAEAREALMKAAGVTEQLEAAQAAHAVMEAELQELKALIASVGRMFSAHTTDLDDDDILKKRRRMSEGEDAEKVSCAVEEDKEIGERIDAKPS